MMTATPLEAFGWTPSGRSVSDIHGPFLDWTAIQQARLSRLEAECSQRGVDAVLVTTPANVLFATNWPRYRHSVHEGAYTALVSFSRPGMIVFASEGDAGLVREDATFRDVRVLPPWQGAWAPVISDAVRDLGLGSSRIALDKAARDAVGTELGGIFGSAEFKAAEPIFNTARAIKSPPEIDAYKHTLGIVEQGLAEAMRLAKEAAFRYSEIELTADANHVLMRRGCTNPDIWCASGPRSAPVRRYPSHRVVRPNEFVVIDGGGILNGYRAEYARSVWSGGIPSARQRQIYATVWKSLSAGRAAMKPGASTAEVERACLEPVRDAGLLEYYGGYPYTGHGIGFGPERPYITARYPELEARLQVGMIVNLEPALWVPGIGGVRLEDTFTITDSGAEQISEAPYESDLI